MKKIVGAAFISASLLLTGACSHKENSEVTKNEKEITKQQTNEKAPFEITEAKVTLVNDKHIVGSIIIKEKGKSLELVPTSLYYKFKIKKTVNKKIYNAGKDNIDVKIIPNKELKSASKDILGFNVYSDDERTGGLGKGIGIGDFNKSGEASLDLNYDLGTTVKNSQMPLVPSKDKLEKLRQKALEGTLVIIRDHKEIARVSLKSVKK